MVKLNKTELATQELMKHEEISNRGHAFIILKEAGLNGSGIVFNKAVKNWEEARGIRLGKSASRERADTEKDMRARAHCMSVAEVREHIESIAKADSLFWACWKVFRHEGKWNKQMKIAEFAVHFNK